MKVFLTVGTIFFFLWAPIFQTVAINTSSTVSLTVKGGGSGADIVPPAVYNLAVFPSTDSVIIKWQTNEPAIYKLSWGRGIDYEGGSIIGIKYDFDHSVLLRDLDPGILYYFRIEAQDQLLNRLTTRDQTFKTLVLPDKTPPANVSNFEAVTRDKEVKLSWKNPPDVDFAGVRIQRSTDFFPKDPYEGQMIYDGKGTSLTDKGLTNGIIYYYSAFAYDNLRNYASGAITYGMPETLIVGPPAKPTIPPIKPPIPPIKPPEKPIVIPSSIQELILDDFRFIQENRELSFKDGKIKAKAGKTLTIAIDYDKLPEVLKTIIISLEKKLRTINEATNQVLEESSFSLFLLRVNHEKTEYNATILLPEEAAIYPLAIKILDYQQQDLKNLEGELRLEREVVKAIAKKEEEQIPFFFLVVFYLFWILFLAVIGYIIWKIIGRKKSLVGPI